jgi:hypothetical protein
MKLFRSFLILGLIAVVAGIGFLLLQPDGGPDYIQIELYSDPFPMAFGSVDLIVSVTDSKGNSVPGADVHVITQELHHSGPEIMTIARRYEDGRYIIPVFWSMAGQSAITVNATHSDGRTAVEEYVTFVYMSPTFNTESRRYRSKGELEREFANVPDDEYWIVVPSGAQEITATEFESFVEPIISLSVSGKNTLVIRNDDFVANSIGPFYVGAGETLRQRFYEPAVYQGVCTINQGPIRIEVSE